MTELAQPIDAAIQSAAVDHRRQRIAQWEAVAAAGASRRGGAAYHRRIEQVFRFLIPPGQRVIELGCSTGDLLATVRPAVGVGVDFAPAMLAHARERHPDLRFIEADVHALPVDEKFDFVILSDLVNDLWDVQAVLEQVRKLCTPQTRVILNCYSRVWQLPLGAARGLGLAQPQLEQNWLTPQDLENLLYLTGFEVIRRWPEVLQPLPIPLLDDLANRFLVRFWPLRNLALTNFFMARPRPESPPVAAPEAASEIRQPRVSVIVPARNEAGNIEAILRRTPQMAGGTEIVFVEGHSKDDTWGEIQRQVAAHAELCCQTMQQTGKGKGDAVRLGFARATGDILMILDADLTVPPEDLPRFVDALRTGRGEFVNGVRLVYPMEKRAMRFLNLIANKFFGLAFSWVLGQPIKDTLCGTKVLWKRDYELLAANRAFFGDFDPFGDFDLIFGAAKLNLKIVDIPIRYRERTYGETNIQRWRHGWMLLEMLLFAARRIKFS